MSIDYFYNIKRLWKGSYDVVGSKLKLSTKVTDYFLNFKSLWKGSLEVVVF